MNDGFYVRHLPLTDEHLLYEYRYGVLAYYSDKIQFELNGALLGKTVDFGWFLSRVDIEKRSHEFEYLEDL